MWLPSVEATLSLGDFYHLHLAFLRLVLTAGDEIMLLMYNAGGMQLRYIQITK